MLDIALTAAFGIAGIVLLFGNYESAEVDYLPGDFVGVLLILGSTVPVLFRRSAPAAAGLIGAIVTSGFLVWNYSAPLAVVVMLILVYSCAAYGTLSGSIGVLLAHLGVSIGYTVTLAETLASDYELIALNAVFSTIGFGGLWAMGRAAQGRRRYLGELEDRTARLVDAREAEVRAALSEERSRIARELHDVVAHHVSVMTVQASGARRLMDRDPERSAEALVAIESTGRAALTEMRRIVGVLRDPSNRGADTADTGDARFPVTSTGSQASSGVSGRAERAPQPSLAELDALAEQFRQAGLPVQVTIDGFADEIPVGVDLTAYRIIQEALTNTIKHAGPSTATIAVQYSPDEVILRITDDGRGLAAALDGRQPGHGLLGMRARVALYGGTLAVGPRRDGGFDVREIGRA